MTDHDIHRMPIDHVDATMILHDGVRSEVPSLVEALGRRP